MQQQTLVWDIPTRLCHWLLVIAISYAWFSVEILEDMEQHFWAGYTILTLLLFRLIWGFVGSRYARFSTFFHPIKETIDYAKNTFSASKTTRQYLGHNPIGSLSALLMLAALVFQASTGLFSNDEYFFGPLSGLISSDLSAELTELHHLNFDVITALIVLHIAAIIFYQFYKKQSLTKAMFTGKKQTEASSTSSPSSISGSRLWLAALVLAFCIAVVYGVATVFADSLPAAESYY